MNNMLNMKIQELFFNYIKLGTKRIELRLYDEKRKQIKIGDELTFINEKEPTQQIKVIVTGLLQYQDFNSLINDFNISILADKNYKKEELLSKLETFYPKEKQKEYSVIGIRFEIKKL